jgi:hypothetical protein
MSPHQKCPHCSRIVAFVNDFCVHCWSHRTRGAVLTPEQVVSSKQQYAAVLNAQRQEAAFEKIQRSTVLPVAILTLGLVWWVIQMLLAMLSGNASLLTLVLPVLCLVGFTVGGFMLGGRKSIALSCVILLVSGALGTIYFGAFLYLVLFVSEESGTDALWLAAGLALVIAIIVGAIRILKTQSYVSAS